MTDLEAVRIETSRHDWHRMRCGCGGTAEHVPRELFRVITAPTPGHAGMAGIDDHVMVGSFTREPAPATAAVIMAALATTVMIPEAKHNLLRLLLWFLGADAEHAPQCEAAVRGGLWSLYRELVDPASTRCAAHAYEILSLIEGEEERLASFHAVVRERLPEDLR